MDYFNYHDGHLYAEQVSLTELAEQYGTPAYVYSRATIERHWQAFDAALTGVDHLVCYAVKANSNLAVLNLMARLGSGFDIVSGGELERVIAAGGDPVSSVVLRSSVVTTVPRSMYDPSCGWISSVCLPIQPSPARAACSLSRIGAVSTVLRKRSPGCSAARASASRCRRFFMVLW